jgi:hypothetical protein
VTGSGWSAPVPMPDPASPVKVPRLRKAAGAPPVPYLNGATMNRCEDCLRPFCRRCGIHYCGELCPCGNRDHNCDCDCGVFGTDEEPPMPKNRVAFLEIEPDGMDVEELWRLTGFARCADCGFVVHTESLTTLPEHYCSRRRAFQQADSASTHQERQA